MRAWRNRLALVLSVLSLLATARSHERGEVVPLELRGQFSGLRTEFTEMPAHYCPRFAQQSAVAVPVPMARTAIGRGAVEEYKLQLSFDAGRVVTPWAKAPLGNQAAPEIMVDLHFAGSTLLSATASVRNLTDMAGRAEKPPHEHAVLRFRWVRSAEMDADAGLAMVSLFSLVSAVIAASRVLKSSPAPFRAMLGMGELSHEGGTKRS